VELAPEIIRLNCSGESVHYPWLVEAIDLAKSTGATVELVSALARICTVSQGFCSHLRMRALSGSVPGSRLETVMPMSRCVAQPGKLQKP